jgi:NAD(P)-dependent dehydrogenase (short-subunit alcohol dehydrogenase family)
MNILITGANRGIGFEFTRQYVHRGERVFATCRQPERAVELQELFEEFPKQLRILPLDVGNLESIRHSHSQVMNSTDSLDLLINNAGVYSAKGSRSPQEALGSLDFDDALSVMRTNSIGPILIVQEYLDLLRASKLAKIVNITSGYGSVSNNTSRYPYYYAASKAALNQLTRSLAFDLRKYKMIALVLDPGWVATEMGGRSAPVSASESVRTMIEVVDRLSSKDNGEFLDRFGEKQDW